MERRVSACHGYAVVNGRRCAGAAAVTALRVIAAAATPAPTA